MNVELLRGKTIEAGTILDQASLVQHETSAIFLGESAIRRTNGRPEAMAVKAFKTKDHGFARREAMIHLAFGGHPNIITPYGFSIEELRDLETGEFPQIPVIAMEYASAGTVKQLLHDGEISLADAVQIASETAYALQSLHDGGYIHRDVKPSNIALVPALEEGLRYHARLLDFGIAMRLNPLGDEIAEERTLTEQTRQGFGGTPDFISPEQLRLNAGYRSDEWSLAEVMRRMIAGRHHDALEAVVKKGHEEDPEDRYPEIAEFGEELIRAHSGDAAVAARDATHIDLGVRARLAADVQAVRGQASVNDARANELDARGEELEGIAAQQAETAQQLDRDAALVHRQQRALDDQRTALVDLREAVTGMQEDQRRTDARLEQKRGELDDRSHAVSSDETRLTEERADFEREMEGLTGTLDKRAEKMEKEEAKRKRALDKREQKVREGEAALHRAEVDAMERIADAESAARERIHGEREVLQGDIAEERQELEEQARVIGDRGEAVTAREQRVGEREVAAEQRDAELDSREERITADAARRNAELDAKAAAFQRRVDAVLNLERRVEGDAAKNAERAGELDEHMDDAVAKELKRRANEYLRELDGLSEPLERLRLIELALALDPENADAYSAKGKALWRLDRKVEALESFDKVIELEPESIQPYSVKGYALEKMGNYQGAISMFDRAIELSSEEVKVFYFQKGLALSELGRYEEAIEAYDQALLDPKHSEVFDSNIYYGKAYALRFLGRKEESFEIYAKAKEVEEREDQLGELYQQIEKQRVDVEFRVNGSSEKLRELYIARAELLANRGKPDDEISLLREFALLYGAYDSINAIAGCAGDDVLMSWIDEQNKYFEKRGKSIDELIALAPNNSHLYFIKGNLEVPNGFNPFEENNDGYESAIVYYDKAIELNPDFYDAYRQKAHKLRLLGRDAEAEEVETKAKEVYAKSKLKEISTLLDKGEKERSLELANNLISTYPEDSRLYDAIGMEYFRTGDYETALSFLDKAVDLNPTNLHALYIKKDLLNKLGRDTEEIYTRIREQEEKEKQQQ